MDFLEILGELLRDFLRFLDPEDDFAFAEPSRVLSEEGVVSPSSQFGQSQGLLGNRFEYSTNNFQNNIINNLCEQNLLAVLVVGCKMFEISVSVSRAKNFATSETLMALGVLELAPVMTE